MPHSMTIDKIKMIENLNHPHDFHIYFEGGSITYNATNGPLRFWYEDDLVNIESEQDMKMFRVVFAEKDFRRRNQMTFRFINLANYRQLVRCNENGTIEFIAKQDEPNLIF